MRLTNIIKRKIVYYRVAESSDKNEFALSTNRSEIHPFEIYIERYVTYIESYQFEVPKSKYIGKKHIEINPKDWHSSLRLCCIHICENDLLSGTTYVQFSPCIKFPLGASDSHAPRAGLISDPVIFQWSLTLNKKKIEIDYLIGTTHSSCFGALGDVGSESKTSFGVLYNPTYLPPFLKSLFSSVFGFHSSKILMQITLHHPFSFL